MQCLCAALLLSFMWKGRVICMPTIFWVLAHFCVWVCVSFMCGCPFRFILTRAHCQYLRVLCPLHLAKGQGGLAARGVLVLRWLTPFTKTPLKDMAEKPSLHSHYLNVTSQLCPGKVGSHRLGRIAKGPKNAAWRWNHYVNVWSGL